MPETRPGDDLRAIADHLDAHATERTPVSVLVHGALSDALDLVLDGATASDITIGEPESSFPTVKRSFGDVDLAVILPARLIAERRPTVVEQVLTATELLARHNQQRLEVQA